MLGDDSESFLPKKLINFFSLMLLVYVLHRINGPDKN